MLQWLGLAGVLVIGQARTEGCEQVEGGGSCYQRHTWSKSQPTLCVCSLELRTVIGACSSARVQAGCATQQPATVQLSLPTRVRGDGVVDPASESRYVAAVQTWDETCTDNGCVKRERSWEGTCAVFGKVCARECALSTHKQRAMR